MRYFLILFCLFLGCGDSSVHLAPVSGSENCRDAEVHLQELCSADKDVNRYCCQIVAPTKKGKTYSEFCQEKESQGLNLNPKCVAKVANCNEIDECTNSSDATEKVMPSGSSSVTTKSTSAIPNSSVTTQPKALP